MLKFIMLVGLPGSGKSTYAKKLIDNNTVWLSSDKIREEIYGTEEEQKNPALVFSLMFDRTVENLNNNKNVIYDATNINRRLRKDLLDRLKRKVNNVFYECVLIYTKLEECKKRNSKRDRKVPEYIIDKMVKNFEVPVKGEGWDNIEVNYTTKPSVPYDKAIDIFVGKEPHDNPHHNMDIDLHMYAAWDYYLTHYEYGIDNYLKYAILFHDIGKKFCKTYYNRNNELCEKAHYYQHANAGAYFAFDIDFSNYNDPYFDGIYQDKEFTENDKYNMIILINYHMRPLEAWRDSKKSENKDKLILGDELSNYLEILNDCDKRSEEDEKFVKWFFEKMVKVYRSEN